jgi:cytochrome c556
LQREKQIKQRKNNKMTKKIFIGTVLAGLIVAPIIGVTTTALAHGGASGIVKERMEVMKSLGEAMKQLKAMFQKNIPYNADDVRKAAQVLKSHGGDKLTKLFPKGSTHKPSEALPKIWTDWRTFKKLADQLSSYASSLEAAAGNKAGMAHGAMMKEDAKASGNQMMAGNSMMKGGRMMMGGASPNVEQLKSMPPMASFMKISQTCSSCHTDFRMKKDK